MQDAALALLLYSGLVMLVVSLRFIAPPPLRVKLLNNTRPLMIAGLVLGILVIAYMTYSLASVIR